MFEPAITNLSPGTRIFAAGDKRAKRRPREKIRAQRPRTAIRQTQEMAEKSAFRRTGFQQLVSEYWVVGAPGLEPGAR
jgi:hypothetical protein